MADFLTNLWESVFTPGTTPTLLIATNVTFASLQLLLFGLLCATYSIHFAILSVLCGGLWYSINWFAVELQAAQRAEDEAERLRKRKSAAAADGERGGELGDADDEGEDTEVEGAAGTRGLEGSMLSLSEGGHDEGMGTEDSHRVASFQEEEESGFGKGSGVQVSGGGSAGEGRQTRQRQTTRKGDLSSSEFSTDSEWEKVSEEGR